MMATQLPSTENKHNLLIKGGRDNVPLSIALKLHRRRTSNEASTRTSLYIHVCFCSLPRKLCRLATAEAQRGAPSRRRTTRATRKRNTGVASPPCPAPGVSHPRGSRTILSGIRGSDQPRRTILFAHPRARSLPGHVHRRPASGHR